ncbi:hypothetical protein NA56DRAFT_741746 [Hyaloscypha hepaticicola]|uniref:Uncharacterized protein n=1 Tax=Hyaloscypha hepaticicola TaxID=2082293 RepID=A0A2J6PDQ7_9HELO|nr:hypothetical protein NA56DRAFT_741746 [Hyaloscypha hepaticicola]
MSSPSSPLVEFPLFTSLPSELRLKNYKQAHHPVRMHKVLAFLIPHLEFRLQDTGLLRLEEEPNNGKEIPHLKFRLQHNGNGTSNAHANTMELALSAACTESRTVFLEQNRYSLLAEQKKGRIRFGKEDIIYISNFGTLRLNLRVQRSNLSSCIRPTISRLALNIDIYGSYSIDGLSFLTYPQEALNIELPLLFQGITLLGLVWRPSTASPSTVSLLADDFLKAASGKLDKFREWMKTKDCWAATGAPQLQLLAYM